MKTNQELFVQQHKKHHRMILILRILLIVCFLLLWEYAARKNYIDAFFFSSPSDVYHCFIQLYQENNLLNHIGVTLLETICSFFLVILLSLLVASILWHFDKAAEVLEPYLVVLNSLPKSALAPLFIVWLGTGIRTIIVAGISVAIFGAIISLYTAFKQTDPEKIKLITTLGGNKKQAFYLVVIPYNIPVIISNMKVNIGLALVGVIIGEFLAAKRGLGYLIIYGSQVFKLSMVITSIVILCIIAMLFYGGLQTLEHHYKKKV
ncbi:MAG: ABC transporter permease [Lachnospiraceae bacterium]|nr:ABC transporter permease [Lachnospiraceae bacterium]